MAFRNIVKIDESKCNGCGKCVNACIEGAIELIDGKAKLVSDIYCDGLGACIGSCPQNAITIEKREAKDFDQIATKSRLAQKQSKDKTHDSLCPGLASMQLRPKQQNTTAQTISSYIQSQLSNWPVQLKLIPAQATFLNEADLLLVADCVPFATGDFHNRFLKNHTLIVGCPKLDDVQFYAEKLSEILKNNKISSLMVIHMEVPCCSGLTRIAQKAIALADKKMAFDDITISLKGDILKTQTFQE